jgi:hypothetical protein
MTSRQRRIARALLSFAFAITAYAKSRAVADGVPEPFAHGHVAMIVAGVFECVVASGVWTRASIVCYWAGAVFVSFGSLAYPFVARLPKDCCGCLGAVRLGPIAHAGLGIALFVLCSMLILEWRESGGNARNRGGSPGRG